MAVASFGGAAMLSMPQASAEEASNVVQLITEPVTSQGNANLDWRQAVTIPMGDRTINSGDVLTLTYTIDTERGPAMTVGGVSVEGLPQMTTSGTWSYTFTDTYSGDIIFGVYTSTFTVSSATLTPAPEKQTHNADIFAGVTEEPANGSYTMGSVTGSIKSDGTLVYNKFDDNTYYVQATDAAVTRVDLPAAIDLEQAYFDGAVLKFSAKFDFASEDSRKAELRIMYSFDSGTDRNFTSTDLLSLPSFKAGEWVEFSLLLTSISQQVTGHTWGGEAEGWFDWANFRGVGFVIESTKAENTHNVVSFGNVRIEGEVKDREITGISVDAPTKTDYFAGDAFDPAGMKVYVCFDDDAKVEIHDYTVEAPAELTQTSVVKVKWDKYEQTVSVTVTQEFVELKIETAPTKTAYKAGEKIDLAGLVLKAVREDDTSETIALNDEKLTYTLKGVMLPEDATEIVFTYKGLQATQAITVAPYEYSLALFGEDSLDEDGDPADGWNVNSIGKSVVSQATYDAASETDQGNMSVIGSDDTGMYLTAGNSDWAVSRVFEVNVADYDLQELYSEPDYLATVAVTYRTSSKTGTFTFGLANFFDWNLGYKGVDITSYVVADGEWHTMYIDIGLFYGNIDGTLWTDDSITGTVDFTKIAGFALKCSKESMDIAAVEVKWNGSADAGKLVERGRRNFGSGVPFLEGKGHFAVVCDCGRIRIASGQHALRAQSRFRVEGSARLCGQQQLSSVQRGYKRQRRHRPPVRRACGTFRPRRDRCDRGGLRGRTFLLRHGGHAVQRKGLFLPAEFFFQSGLSARQRAGEQSEFSGCGALFLQNGCGICGTCAFRNVRQHRSFLLGSERKNHTETLRGDHIQMKITDIKTFVVDCFRTNWVFVKVYTDEGLCGVGEGTLEYKEKALVGAVEHLKSSLLGKDPRQIEKHYHDLYRDVYWRGGAVLMSALSAVEMALWDILGKSLGIPVYQLLGGKVNEDCRIYVNGWFAGAKEPQEFAEKAEKKKKKGVTAMKWDPFGKSYLQISNRDLDKAIRCIAAVREAVGEQVDLLIEAHGRFDVPTGIKIAQEVAPFRPMFLEEPVPPNNLEALKAVRDKSPVAISAGERLYTRFDYNELFRLRAADYIQPDVSHAGGIMELKKLAAIAEANYIPFAPHNPSGPVANAATLQIAACCPNFCILEIMYSDVEYRKDITDEQLSYADGKIKIGSRPGIGIELNEAECLKHPYREHNLRHYTGALTDIRPPKTAFYF